MIKPIRLHKGDKVAAITLSWGGAGEFSKRYKTGKKQLQDNFKLEVVETRNALKSAEWIYKNPKARADDLMETLEDKSIKAIISNIGGEDSIRILPYVDLNIIRKNPKIFLGSSDNTITHFCFYKAGVTSFYGISILEGFAENNGIHKYQVDDINQTLFSGNPIGKVEPNLNGWTSEFLDWGDSKNQNISRKLQNTTGWRFLQGDGKVQGELLGGCVEVLEFLKDTDYWVKPSDWKGKIMFLETSEYMLKPDNFRWIMRNYASSGILKNIAGLIVGRPYENMYWKEYDEILLKVIRDEEGLKELPIITGMNFGHTSPVFTIPYGINALIDVNSKTFSILEGSLVD